MKRRPRKPPPERWIATRDRAGCLTIVTVDGGEPLRATDPVARLMAVYLAASAPDLRFHLERVLRRMSYLIELYSSTRHVDGKLMQGAWAALADSRPPLGELLAAQEGARQLELDLSNELDYQPGRGVA